MDHRLLLASSIALAGCAERPRADAPAPAPTVAFAPRPAVPTPSPLPTSTPIPTGAVATPPPPPEAQGDGPKLAVEGEGLRWFLPNGSARPIPFGTAEAAVLAALERVRGPAGTGTNHSCGAGPVQYASWPDGLALVFQRGRFVGWSLDARAADALSTVDGIGPGTTRVALDAAYGDVRVERTTLGSEFDAGAVHGVLDGPGRRAKITDLWAGVSCAAR